MKNADNNSEVTNTTLRSLFGETSEVSVNLPSTLGAGNSPLNTCVVFIFTEKESGFGLTREFLIA